MFKFVNALSLLLLMLPVPVLLMLDGTDNAEDDAKGDGGDGSNAGISAPRPGGTVKVAAPGDPSKLRHVNLTAQPEGPRAWSQPERRSKMGGSPFSDAANSEEKVTCVSPGLTAAASGWPHPASKRTASTVAEPDDDGGGGGKNDVDDDNGGRGGATAWSMPTTVAVMSKATGTASCTSMVSEPATRENSAA